MRIAVTGASGFIGKYVSEKIFQAGHEIVCLISPRNVWDDRVKSHKVIQVDLTDLSAVKNVLNKNIDLLVHFAAVIPKSFNDSTAFEAARINELMDKNIF